MSNSFPPDASQSQIPRAALAGVTASVAVFAIAQGLASPLFTFMMQEQGYSPGMIGLSAAMTPIGLVASATFVPAIVRICGARNLAVACALLAAVLFLAVGLLQNTIAWFPIRFLIGVVINPLYILGEVWILALAPSERRGRVMGIFNAVTGAGYATGPLSLALVGTNGWPPLLVGALCFFGCAAMLYFTTANLRGFEEDGGQTGGVWRFWTLAPALLVAVIVSAATQQSIYAMLPVFGASYGLGEARLASLITVLSLGNIFVQIPLGYLAERFGARAMIVSCAVTNMVGVLLLPLVITNAAIWPLLVVIGGVGYGVYTMAMVELGNRFTGSTLVAGNAAFALMWGVGGIVGPPGSGFVMQQIGASGLPAVIGTLSALLVLFSLYRSLTRRKA